ncbi:hypothetical protein [Radiobacillus deserti]|uniref:Uncharacterized protein n=1 Tax=Radiobacillus deserti TaxID=2594883 RepID=A0A516KH41_9BACI|nr:hypothetical protein [Radiobacillus deserti]QDP40712.1 hypothetical protein FN924_11260 [Radiobacillus deserti]
MWDNSVKLLTKSEPLFGVLSKIRIMVRMFSPTYLMAVSPTLLGDAVTPITSAIAEYSALASHVHYSVLEQ